MLDKGRGPLWRQPVAPLFWSLIRSVNCPAGCLCGTFQSYIKPPLCLTASLETDENDCKQLHAATVFPQRAKRERLSVLWWLTLGIVFCMIWLLFCECLCFRREINTAHRIMKDVFVLKDSLCRCIFLRKRINLVQKCVTSWSRGSTKVPPQCFS